jgi:hypothetical protein
MAYTSNKNLSIAQVQLSPVGGINLALPPHAINENELQQAQNFIYLPHSGKLATRPAFSCDSSVAAPGEILNIHPYGDHLVCSCSDGKLYRYDLTTKVFTDIHDLAGGPYAVMITFNQKVLFVDGTGLYSWDGATVELVTDTFHPSTISEISNRVVINNKLKGEEDAVYFSGPEDETDWDMTNGAAVGLRAGYGDGMEVNALSTLGMDLIVSKAGGGNRYIYRVNCAGIPAQWSANKLAADTSSAGPMLIDSVPNDVLYVSEESELRSLAGVQEYGDIEVQNVGEKINPLLVMAQNEGFTPSMIRYLPVLDVLALIFSGKLCFYHHASRRFTTAVFDEGRIVSVCELDGEVYWGSSHGWIYKWTELSDQDEYNPGKHVQLKSKLKSKIYSFPRESLLKHSRLSYAHLLGGGGTVRVNGVLVMDFPIFGAPWYLFEADDTYLYDANMPLYEMGEEDTVMISRSRTRQVDMTVEIETLSGRLGLNYFEADVAQVNG